MLLNQNPVKRSKYLVITEEILLPLFIMLILTIGLYLVFFSPLFSLQNIVCRQDGGECQNPSVIAELSQYQGQNLLTLQLEPLRRKLQSGDFTIARLRLLKVLPQTLEVEITTVQPDLALQVGENSSTWIALDSQYRVIGTLNSDQGVVTLIIDSPPIMAVGQRITDENILASLDFASKLSSHPDISRRLSVAGDTITLYLENGKRALLTTHDDWSAQIKSLQAVLSNSTMVKDSSVIDVRFVRPVLK